MDKSGIRIQAQRMSVLFKLPCDIVSSQDGCCPVQSMSCHIPLSSVRPIVVNGMRYRIQRKTERKPKLCFCTARLPRIPPYP